MGVPTTSSRSASALSLQIADEIADGAQTPRPAGELYRGVFADGCVLLPPSPPRHVVVARAKQAGCSCCCSCGGADTRHVAQAGETNCALELYWQLGPDEPEESARLSLLEHLMWEPLFNQLRTKQQLGYSVGCSARNTAGVLGFMIGVVSARFEPATVEERVGAFVKSWIGGARLREISSR